MTVATVLLLALSAAVSVVPPRISAPPRRRLVRWILSAAPMILLGAAAITGASTTPAHGAVLAITLTVTLLAAVTGGSPIVTAVFRLARRGGTPDPDGSGGPLHGGRTIGVLERTAVAASILAGWPEGIAIVLAVKGLARYPELRESENAPTTTPAASSASEQFIIGTFTSVLWAAAVCGVGLLVVR